MPWIPRHSLSRWELSTLLLRGQKGKQEGGQQPVRSQRPLPRKSQWLDDVRSAFLGATVESGLEGDTRSLAVLIVCSSEVHRPCEGTSGLSAPGIGGG